MFARTLREAEACIKRHVRDCDVLQQAYNSFVDEHLKQLMIDCGIANDAGKTGQPKVHFKLSLAIY